VLSGKAGAVQLTIEGPVYERLRAFCRAHQTTAFAVLLAAFRATHYRLTGAEDATIGTPIANRNRPELESMIGFFVNAQCMRITAGDDDTFETLIRQVRSMVTPSYPAHGTHRETH
jgi:non-ribosomal peptide synthetase component F